MLILYQFTEASHTSSQEMTANDLHVGLHVSGNFMKFLCHNQTKSHDI